MSPHADTPDEAGRGERPGPTQSATPMQRMGLAVLSLMALAFLVNVMSALASAFGAIGSVIELAAICLVIVGINVAFNLDLLVPREKRRGSA
jgi:hypothetical protein